MSGGLVWGKKCTAVLLLGRSMRSVQELRIEVAQHAAGISCPGMDRPWYVRGAQYARECPARAHHRSVRVRTGRVYGCSVLARGQETIHVDAERVHRRVCAREGREL